MSAELLITETPDRQAYQHSYYLKNSGKAKTKAKKWQDENRERFNELHRANYQKNAPKRRAAWRIARLKYRQNSPLKYLVNLAASRSRNRGVEFSITPNDLSMPMHCPLLGIPLDMKGLNHDSKPSIDRIDNTRGYVPGNVIIVSQRANRIKSDATSAELNLMATNLKRIEGMAGVNFGN
jgi:hypothetical protein